MNKIFEITVEEKLDFTGATLLSIEEAEEYLTKGEREYDFWWWLRSPGNNSSSAALVVSGGSIGGGGDYVDYTMACVRPALQIKNLDESSFEIGDTFKMGDYEFKVISENLAWMYKQDIGCYAFNEDLEKGNNYKKSNIKKFVDEWFKLLMLNEWRKDK